MKRGVWQAVAAYTLWGLLPLYWKALHEVPALQLIAFRVVWASLFLTLFLFVRGQVRAFRVAAFRTRTIAIYAVAAALLGANWLTYVWGVNAGFVVETSLGYFINPLLSVLLGVVFLGERLRRVQWVSLGLAAAGVSYLAIDYGRLPWIALVLAFTFAVYGLVKKLAPLAPVEGLALETGMLFVPGVAVLAYAQRAGEGFLIGSGWLMFVALAGTGVVTIVPLLLFASSVRRIPLVWVGVLQYIAPTLQFLLGVFIFRESVSVHTVIGFAAVWAALALFAGEALVRKVSAPITAE